MTYTLLIWTIVSSTHMAGGYRFADYDWRPLLTISQRIGEQEANQRCHEAARQLGLEASRYRCVKT